MRKSILALVLLAAASAQAVKNKDWYVSDDMQYGREYEPRNCTNDLQYAVTNCTAGYTVWVKDGFVWDKGSTKSNYNYTRLIPKGKIVVRSESGHVDEAKGEGATIRGDLTGTGVRCAEMPSGAKLIGFILENGKEQNISYGGGAAYLRADTVISNCVVRNCQGVRGAAFGGIGKIYDTVITNNAGTGGVLYKSTLISGCEIRDNQSRAIWYYEMNETSGVVTNTTIANNEANGMGVAVYANTSPNISLWDCVITNNTTTSGGAIAGYAAADRIAVHHCQIVNNSGVDGAGAYRADLSDRCVVAGNVATDGSGAGLNDCSAVDCTIMSNVLVRVSSSKAGGVGAEDSFLTNCTIVGNVCRTSVTNTTACSGGGIRNSTAVGCTIRDNVAFWRGGGAYGSVLHSCYIAGNALVGTNSTGGGAGAYDCAAYNCLVRNNRSARGTGGMGNNTYAGCAINCTVTGNVSGNGGVGGANGVPMVVNTISYGNDPDTNFGGYCTNSCLAALTKAKASEGIVSTDPRLDANFYPHARACKNTGVVFDWMTDADDVRSKDLAGKPRIIGEKPDMGAFECLPVGLMLMLR